jgi:hypothetical protein
MTRNDLHLCCAIRKADLGGGDRPTSGQRQRAAILVVTEWIALTGCSYFPFTIDDIERWSIALRKSNDTKVKVDIALAHGLSCYFENRGKGPCSAEVEGGHILQRCKGGPLSVENGQIECWAHNNQRREMSIEDYLKSNLKTSETLEKMPMTRRELKVTKRLLSADQS